jgi:hypothetical protein
MSNAAATAAAAAKAADRDAEIIPLTRAGDTPPAAPGSAAATAPAITGSKGTFYETDYRAFFAVPPPPQK